MIQHVAIEIREADVDACVRFWALLGFERVRGARRRSPPARPGCRPAPTQIHLLHADAPVVAPEGHVAVVVADYEATLAALRDAGFEPAAAHASTGARRGRSSAARPATASS